MPSIGTESNLKRNGCGQRLTSSTASRGTSSSSSSSSSGTNPGFLLSTQPGFRTMMGGSHNAVRDNTKSGGEEEGRRPDAAGIETAGASSGRSFRVRLTHASGAKMYSEPLNSLRDASSLPSEAGAHWREPAEKIVRQNSPTEHSVEQQQQECQPKTYQQQELHVGMDAADPNGTEPLEPTNRTATITTGAQLLESKPILEEVRMQRAQEKHLSNVRETQLREMYEAKIAELEGVIHASQRAASGAEAVILQKELEWQTARTPMAQKFNEEAVSNVSCLLETTLRAREKELEDTREMLRIERARWAGALQREEVLRNRFLVAEETRVLYQLYLQRLLEFLRTRVKERSELPPHTEPLVTHNAVVKAMGEALRSADAATNEEVNAMHEFSPEGARGKVTVELHSPPEPSRQLTNATLLTMSMLESTVKDCMTLLGREEKRRHDHFKQTLQAVVNGFTEELEAKLALILSFVGKTEQRIGEYEKMAAHVFGRIVRNAHERGNQMYGLQKEVERASRECTQSQRLLTRAQAEVSGLKDEIRRMDGDREVALLVHRAAECLEDVRQSVRGAVRSAAQDIEQRTLECNTLKEPFLQSMRVIALKVESNAEMARTAIRRRQHEDAGNPIETVVRGAGSVDAEEMHRLILSTPCFDSRSRERHTSQIMRGDMAGESKNLLMLEELSRVMKNLCRLLENNARQMDNNAAKLSQTIAAWEDSIVKKMTEIWESMHEMLVASGIPPRPAPVLTVLGGVQRREGGNSAPLFIGDTNAGNSVRMLVHKTQPVCSSATVGSRPSCTGSLATSGSCAPSVSFAQSTISSTDVSRAASTAIIPSWRAPLAPLQEVEQTPEMSARHSLERPSPQSIAVSRTPTPPPPPLSSQMTNTVPPSQRPPPQQKQNLYQQRQLFVESPCNSPRPVMDSGAPLRMHYTGELSDFEGCELRSSSGAVHSRCMAASSQGFE
ncbi:hypothetical protein MOQ_004210 [Trypanosoma cruzi marinkellei]|uniref:Uncharacterized protein n=1 Tax=Trypanosoma cruzi marinkellei TaxID=85056 RepID=K2N1U2_TRYCR|nr:hypothetical protein MOQ_004210 [Trypanosoma cruzi marinkellei]